MPSSGKIPLHLRDPDATIASCDGKPVTASEFEQTVTTLAQRFPKGQHAVNLCANRLNFLYALTSVVAAGQVNLLPPNRQPGTIADLARQYPETWLLHDGQFDENEGLASVNITSLLQGVDRGSTPPPIGAGPPGAAIEASRLAAVSFTSGSTGVPGANRKTWGMLLDGARVNADNLLLDAPAGLNILATVPAQHMYGLEMTISLPLVAGVTMQSGQPLFPVDITEALAATKQPRALVTTPQHLRALLDSGLQMPVVDIVYCATAPLDQATARRAEEAFSGCLTEVYGCSEIGSVARRRTAKAEKWTPFSSMDFRAEGELTLVQAPHVPEAVPLQDQLELHADGSFILRGRLGDLINIAGKRGSFAQLNKVLLEIEGVTDGVIFNPAETSAGVPPKTARLAALVVSDNLNRAMLLKQLRNYIDPVFLPRPVLFCDKLPRNENGKLPRQALMALWQEIKQQS